MKNSKKVILQYSEASTNELNDILENSFFKQQKPTPSPIKKQETLSVLNIFEKIKQMRKFRDAPVDLLGPQNLFDKTKDLNIQRFQILCSLMLSPQTKDEATAKCSRRLLDYTIEEIANMKESELTKLVYEVNFNATKAKRIKEMAQKVRNSTMPSTLEQTMEIKGVGEKIALLYIQYAYQEILGIAVDVNMIRICNRIPITREKSPTKIRKILESEFDKSVWGEINETLVGFGQQICLPKPKCQECRLESGLGEIVLGMAFLVLGMIYSTIFCFGFFRFCKMNSKSKYLGTTFYFSIILSCLAYMSNMALYLYDVFGVQNGIDDQIEKQLLNTIYVPDGVFWVVYQSLFWTLVCLHYDSRLHIGQINELPYNPHKLITSLHYIFIVYGIAQLIIVLLYNFDYLSADILFFINITINLSLPLQFTITSLYLQCKYSGSPFKSQNYENKANRLQKLIIFWTIMRLVQIANNFILVENKDMISKFFSQQLSKVQLLSYVSVLILDLLLANIIPFILALRQQTVYIFINRNNTTSMLSENPMRQQFLNDDSSIMEKKLIPFDFTQLQKEGVIGNQKRQKTQAGFGYITNCTINQKQYGMRIIAHKQLQNYLIEQIKQEIEKINSLNNKYLYHIHGIFIAEDKIVYLVKFYQQSLHDYLQQKVSDEEKIELLIQLMRGVSYLHSQNMCHGQLTSTNVMLNKNKRIKIVDFGIFGIKKYQSLLCGYSSKSGFTAPELLLQKGQMLNGTKEGDIYSIGMIMYEMFEKKVPFEGLEIQNIQDCMNKKIRPKIESKSYMDDIIRWCWQQECEKRPKIDQLLNVIENIQLK